MNKHLKFIIWRKASLLLIGMGILIHVGCDSNHKETAGTENPDKADTMQTVTSKDGTKIAYDKTGQGPAVILVNGALATRSAYAELAQLLAPHFTVYNYDRRGRGNSSDNQQYFVEREIEDLDALIDEAGDSAYVFGASSGACLALQAAATLGDKVRKFAIYEAPYDESEGAADKWKEYKSKFAELIANGRRGDAVEHHLNFAGVPAEMIAKLKTSPEWISFESMASTISYDMAAVGDDRSVPVERAAQVKANALVMDGGASLKTLPFMRPSADKIASAIPNAQRRTIEGETHNVSSKALAPFLIEFFSKR